MIRSLTNIAGQSCRWPYLNLSRMRVNAPTRFFGNLDSPMFPDHPTRHSPPMPSSPVFNSHCSVPASTERLDTRYLLETPEGIDLILRPAGLVPRALAFAIDLAIRGLILLVMFILLGLLGKFGMGLGTLLLFLLTWWYMVLFEVLNQGRSPGKQLMKLRVVHDDGTPVGWAASLTRKDRKSVVE